MQLVTISYLQYIYLNSQMNENGAIWTVRFQNVVSTLPISMTLASVYIQQWSMTWVMKYQIPSFPSILDTISTLFLFNIWTLNQSATVSGSM